MVWIRQRDIRAACSIWSVEFSHPMTQSDRRLVIVFLSTSNRVSTESPQLRRASTCQSPKPSVTGSTRTRFLFRRSEIRAAGGRSVGEPCKLGRKGRRWVYESWLAISIIRLMYHNERRGNEFCDFSRKHGGLRLRTSRLVDQALVWKFAIILRTADYEIIHKGRSGFRSAFIRDSEQNRRLECYPSSRDTGRLH